MAVRKFQDADVVLCAAKGNDRPFTEFVETYRPALVGHIHERIIGRSHQSAEDIGQEAWRVLWGDLVSKTPATGGFDVSKGSLYTYLLCRFVRYMILQYNKKLLDDSIQDIREPNDIEQRLDELKEKQDAWTKDEVSEIIRLEDEARLRKNMFYYLLFLLFRCGGYPHEQMAFAFSKLIYGKPSVRGLEGKPKEVDRNQGGTTLEALVDGFPGEFMRASDEDDADFLDFLRRCLDPVRMRMKPGPDASTDVQTLMERDRSDLGKYHEIRTMQVAETTLRLYYERCTGGFTKAIPDWCSAVQRRVSQASRAQGLAMTGESCEAQRERGSRLSPDECLLGHLLPCREFCLFSA